MESDILILEHRINLPECKVVLDKNIVRNYLKIRKALNSKLLLFSRTIRKVDDETEGNNMIYNELVIQEESPDELHIYDFSMSMDQSLFVRNEISPSEYTYQRRSYDFNTHNTSWNDVDWPIDKNVVGNFLEYHENLFGTMFQLKPNDILEEFSAGGSALGEEIETKELPKLIISRKSVRLDSSTNIDHSNSNEEVTFHPQFYHCNDCEYKCRQKLHLLSHIINKHTDEFKDNGFARCPNCRKKFKYLLSFKKHRKVCGRFVYTCTLCPWRSKYTMNVMQHLRSEHTKEIHAGLGNVIYREILNQKKVCLAKLRQSFLAMKNQLLMGSPRPSSSRGRPRGCTFRISRVPTRKESHLIVRKSQGDTEVGKVHNSSTMEELKIVDNDKLIQMHCEYCCRSFGKLNDTESCPICRVKLSFKCVKCSKLADTFYKMKRHLIESCNAKYLYKCDICSFMTPRLAHMNRHKGSKHSRQRRGLHKCHSCSYKTPFKYTLMAHVASEHRVDTAAADERGDEERRVYKEGKQSRRGVGITDTMRKYHCDNCNVSFDYIRNINNNRIMKYCPDCGKSLQFVCTKCKKICLTPKRLYMQVKYVCFVKKKSNEKYQLSDQHYYCDHCTFNCKDKSDLQTHICSLHIMENVKDVEPFKCFFCDFKSTDKYNHSEHLKKVHSMGKQYSDV